MELPCLVAKQRPDVANLTFIGNKWNWMMEMLRMRSKDRLYKSHEEWKREVAESR